MENTSKLNQDLEQQIRSSTPHDCPTELIYQLTITLVDTCPKIWRRVQLPHCYTFRQLHQVIQLCMGWQNNYMYEFLAYNFRLYKEDRIGQIFQGLAHRKVLPDDEIPLYDYLNQTKHKSVTYFYSASMIETWVHRIELERILPMKFGIAYPVCTGGRRQCPPQGVGGTRGFYLMLRILKEPSHPHYKSFKDWIGGDFDQDMFKKWDVPLHLIHSMSKGPKHYLPQILHHYQKFHQYHVIT